jgi:hypothetical protein
MNNSDDNRVQTYFDLRNIDSDRCVSELMILMLKDFIYYYYKFNLEPQQLNSLF